MAELLYDVEGITFKGNQMILKIDKKEYTFDLFEISERLAKASKLEREKHEVSPSGYGIHWPLIDEDLSIPGLLRIASKFPGRDEVETASMDRIASDKVPYGQKS